MTINENSLTFAQLNLSKPISKAITDVGYETPSPIQAQAIPLLMEGRDLLGQAQTGTGKTAAFALPFLSRINPRKSVPQILVLAPTRELALQVAEAMQTYSRHLKNFHVLPVYGGQNMSQQLRTLSRGVQVVVGTPGRIQDHLNRGTLKLDAIDFVVLDEADEMLKMGFVDEVEEILRHTPEQKQVALFSATMPNEVMRVAKRHLHDPAHVRIQTKTSTVTTIQQVFWQVKGLHKLDALTRILEAEEIDGMIVFTRTKIMTVELAEKLAARGFSVAPLNGDMTQGMREKTVEQLKSGKLDIVVATDVAARGLDVPRISHVVNYDIPYDTESYVHRIGRTGRAGRDGKAILFVAPRERRMLMTIERATRQPIKPMVLPSRQQITDRRVHQFKEQVAQILTAEDLEFFEQLIDDTQAQTDADHRQIAAAMAFLLQKDRPLKHEGRDELPTASDARGMDWKAKQDAHLQRYRIEVGRSHGVEPRHIVGAISNEAHINSRQIGQIKLHNSFSLVDLPRDLPETVLAHLHDVWVCGQKLKITVDSSADKHEKKRFYRKPGDKRPYKTGTKKRLHARQKPKTKS